MKSVTTARFRKAYEHLPPHIQQAARKAFDLWKKDIHHPGLQFKQIHSHLPIYSVRIALA